MADAARSAPPVPARSFDEQALRLGKSFIAQLHILLKTAQIHDAGNVALEAPVEHGFEALRQLWRWNPEVTLRIHGDYLSLNDLKMKMDIDTYTSFTSVLEILRRYEIGQVTFKNSLSKPDFVRFCYLLLKTSAQVEDPFEAFAAQLQRSGITAVEIEVYEELPEQDQELLRDAKEAAKSVYFKTLTTVSEVMEDIKLGQAVSVKRAKRVVQAMVDLLLQEETTILGLTTLRSHDEYTHNHSVNVCVLALALAQRLGYPKKLLTEVGVAALFHDLGKALIPAEVLNKATEFTEEEWRVMRRHPVQGVKLLLKLKGINETTIRMVIGVFEHHLNMDNSGYPKLDRMWSLSLLGRMISLCDCYDALTSSRVYNRVPYTPERALKFMLAKSGTAFDPTLMKIFVNSIGIFPIGTVVLLDTGEMAVVMAISQDPQKAERPKVKLITDTSGNESVGEIIDLSEKSENSGNYARNVVKTIDPFRYKIDVSRYFL